MGEITEVVNTGVTLIHLVANHAGNHVQGGQFANGLPAGSNAADLTGWQSHAPIKKVWKHTSDWYEFWKVDMDFTVSMKFQFGGSLHGVGQFVDQITVELDVEYLPVDFTLDVTANFPPTGLRGGSDDAPVGYLDFQTVVQLNGFLGQAIYWTRTLNCKASGDGSWEMG
jgi:hypothetical protein